jgi:hypothetical protein
MRISYCLIPFCGNFNKITINFYILIQKNHIGIPVVYFAGKEAVEKIVIEYKFYVFYLKKYYYIVILNNKCFL